MPESKKITPKYPDGRITPDALETLRSLLEADLPEEAIERSLGKQTGRGYDTTGYKVDYVMQRMTEVLGRSYWRAVPAQIIHEEEVKFKSSTGWSVAVQVCVQVGNWVDGTFVPIAEAYSYGGATNRDYGDAAKGAESNAKKKAIAQFGPGWKAYAGLIDDDNVSLNGETEEPAKATTTYTTPYNDENVEKARSFIDQMFRQYPQIEKELFSSEESLMFATWIETERIDKAAWDKALAASAKINRRVQELKGRK